MQNENKKRRIGGRGYYIALIVCLAAVGISGYVFVRTARDSAVETVAPAVISTTPGATAKARGGGRPGGVQPGHPDLQPDHGGLADP